MNMRFLTIVFFCFFCGYSLYSQAKNSISGIVQDAAQKSPLEFATISIYKSGAAHPFDGSTSDTKGVFVLKNLAAGYYHITIEFLGYSQVAFDSLRIGDNLQGISLGTVYLSPASKQLREVTVTAKAPVIQNKIDKLVYNAEADLTSQGGAALDVLKKVPMVSVDLDGNVELQGNANVKFLINGKPSSIFGASLADALQSIPAAQIKNIEVITSPGARYDAAGTGGIINIILKDSRVQGINGSVNLSAGTRLENGSVNLNVRKGKVGAGVFFNGNDQLKAVTKNSSDRLSYNTTRDTINRLFQNGSNPFTRGSYQAGVSFNWSLAPKQELTATFGFHHFGNHATGTTVQEQQTILADRNQVLNDVQSTRTSDSRFSANATDWSLAYKKTYQKEGQELNVLYTSSFSSNTNSASQVSDYYNNYLPASGLRSNNPGSDHQTEISMDYTQPVTKGFVIETGAKLGIENLDNNVITDTLLGNSGYVNNHGQSYGFAYKRTIYAGYFSGSFTLFHSFLEAKAGLRYERTSNTADFPGTSIPGYNTFAPSVMLQHAFSESQSVKFAYSSRIERPDYGDLNPFFNISDPHNITTGNPLLRPEVGHGYELGYNHSFNKSGNFYVAAFYRHNTDDIQGFTTYYPILNVNGTSYTDVTLTHRENIGWQTNVGISMFGSVQIADKLNLRSNIQLGDRTNATPGLATVTGFAYRVNLNASYQFPHDLIAETFGNYNSSSKNIQGLRPAFFFYNLAVRKQFMHKKASLGLTAANPFNRYIRQVSTTYGANFNQTNIRLLPLQSFGITLTYKFGKLEFKKSKEDDNTPAQPSYN